MKIAHIDQLPLLLGSAEGAAAEVQTGWTYSSTLTTVPSGWQFVFILERSQRWMYSNQLPARDEIPLTFHWKSIVVFVVVVLFLWKIVTVTKFHNLYGPVFGCTVTLTQPINLLPAVMLCQRAELIWKNWLSSGVCLIYSPKTPEWNLC